MQRTCPITARPTSPITDLPVCWVAIVLHSARVGTDRGSEVRRRGSETVQIVRLAIKNTTRKHQAPELLHGVPAESLRGYPGQTLPLGALRGAR